jgi:hypothetical protein
MKLKYLIISSLAFAQFSAAQDAKEVKIHNDLSTALEQVDTDGEFLQIEKSSKLFTIITEKLDEYVLPEMVKSGELPAAFSFAKMLDLSGISEITASSLSVKKDGSSYITKSFNQTNGSRKGLLSLLGKADKPWASLEYAPANTALLLETHLDLTAMPAMMKQIAPMLEEPVAEQMLAGLKEKDPIAGKTVEELVLQADARISIIAELDETKTWEEEGLKFPAIQVTGRIDGIAKFLWENYGKVIAQQVPVKSEGNIHTIVSPEQIPAPWGMLTPVIVIDTDKNHIWFSLSAEHLEACKSGKSKLTDNEDFKVANKGSRDTGAARIYISKSAMTKASDLLVEVMKKEMAGEQEQKIITDLANFFAIKSSISICVSHDDKGLLINTYAPLPMRAPQMGMLPVISSLAGLSYAPTMRHLESSQRTEDIVLCKNIFIALMGYMAANNGQLPENLQQLVDGGHIEKKFLTLKNRELFYVKGLNAADVNKVILYTSPDKNGMAVYVTLDGATRTIDELELQKMLADQ